MMDPGRYAHVIDVGLLLEIEMDSLHIIDLEISLPERRRVDAISKDCTIPDPLTDTSQALNRKPQPVLVRSAPAVIAVIVKWRKELPGQIAVREV